MVISPVWCLLFASPGWALQPSPSLQSSRARQLLSPLASRSSASPSLSPRRHLRASTELSAAAAVPPAPPPEGTSVSAAVINLAKNIVGSGVLALAAGVAAFSGSPLALAPSLALLVVLGGISGYTFSVIGRVGEAVGADTYRDTWAKIFGEKSSILPDATVVFMTAVGESATWANVGLKA